MLLLGLRLLSNRPITPQVVEAFEIFHWQKDVEQVSLNICTDDEVASVQARLLMDDGTTVTVQGKALCGDRALHVASASALHAVTMQRVRRCSRAEAP